MASYLEKLKPGKIGLWDKPDLDEWNEAVFQTGNVAMTEIHAILFSRTKPSVVCWGCGKIAGEKEKYQGCPMCKNKDFLHVAPFCSQQCFANNWSSHKEWHKNNSKEGHKLESAISEMAEGIKEHYRMPKVRRELNTDSDGNHVEGWDENMIEQMFDTSNMDKAKKKIRKAAKKEPALYANHYAYLGSTHLASGRLDESIQYYFLEVQSRAANALKFHILGKCIDEDPTEQEDRLCKWACNVGLLLFSCMSRSGSRHHLPPGGWPNDSLSLKKVTKGALNVLAAESVKNDGELATLDSSSPMVERELFASMFTNRLKIFEMGAACLGPPGTKTPEELTLTLDEVQEVLPLSDSFLASECGEDFHLALKTATKKLETTGGTSGVKIGRWNILPTPALPAGTWVYVLGLNLLGLVCEAEPRKGKVPVQMEGQGSNHYYLEMEHVQEIPLSDATIAMLCCLEESLQWKFMMIEKLLLQRKIQKGLAFLEVTTKDIWDVFDRLDKMTAAEDELLQDQLGIEIAFAAKLILLECLARKSQQQQGSKS